MLYLALVFEMLQRVHAICSACVSEWCGGKLWCDAVVCKCVVGGDCSETVCLCEYNYNANSCEAL